MTKVYTTAEAIKLRLMAACPECNSSAIVKRRKTDDWRCHECKHVCTTPVYRDRMKSGNIHTSWNKAEVAYLKRNYSRMYPRDIARQLNRSVYSVYAQAVKQKVRVMDASYDEPSDVMANKNWSDVDVQYLRDNYFGVRTHVIADVLGRSVDSVRRKAQRCGIYNGLKAYGGRVNV